MAKPTPLLQQDFRGENWSTGRTKGTPRVLGGFDLETEECVEKSLCHGIPFRNQRLSSVRVEAIPHNLSSESVESGGTSWSQYFQGVSARADITNTRQFHNDGSLLKVLAD